MSGYYTPPPWALPNASVKTMVPPWGFPPWSLPDASVPSDLCSHGHFRRLVILKLQGPLEIASPLELPFSCPSSFCLSFWHHVSKLRAQLTSHFFFLQDRRDWSIKCSPVSAVTMLSSPPLSPESQPKCWSWLWFPLFFINPLSPWLLMTSRCSLHHRNALLLNTALICSVAHPGDPAHGLPDMTLWWKVLSPLASLILHLGDFQERAQWGLSSRKTRSKSQLFPSSSAIWGKLVHPFLETRVIFPLMWEPYQ